MRYVLRGKRVEKGIRQAELAKKIGISRQMLGAIESGKTEPKRDLMLQIADALDEDVTILFFNKREE